MRFLLLFCGLLLCSCKRNDPALEAELRPVIAYVDGFIQDHHRLPTQEEFQAAMAGQKVGLILLDRSNEFANRKGARAETDYMVGDWGSDWFYGGDRLGVALPGQIVGRRAPLPPARPPPATGPVALPPKQH